MTNVTIHSRHAVLNLSLKCARDGWSRDETWFMNLIIAVEGMAQPFFIHMALSIAVKHLICINYDLNFFKSVALRNC